ncbi:EamA/RhaT family transporter [Marinomonas piezotolerans]|uniref:EamA/RhaT family transporter n=1 Tax=Marinomonas piezotolerans TaxID=2213058 RepID=A0A370UC82_9GAMM|nr:DMT family transporter [Marinomonas piezotolerans]RDL45403.1 EamA/RhaT family transporter [Marinomonas piezotolerans]
MTIQSHRVAMQLLILVSFIWGAEFVLIDMAIETIPVNTFNALRFALAGCALLPLYWFTRHSLPSPQPRTYALRSLLSKGAVLGLLLCVGFYMQTAGMKYTSVSNAGFITGLNVPLVPIMSFLLFRTYVRFSVWLGVGLAMTGLYLLTVGDKLMFNFGDGLVLICALCFAIHIVLTGRFVTTLPVIPLTIVQLFAVSIYSACAAYISPTPVFHYEGHPPLTFGELVTTPLVFSAIVIAGVFGTAYAYWAQSACQQLLPDYKVALVFTLEPLFACLTAWLVLNEQLGLAGMVGAAAIILGMIIAELGESKTPNKETIRPFHEG